MNRRRRIRLNKSKERSNELKRRRRSWFYGSKATSNDEQNHQEPSNDKKPQDDT